MHFSGNAEGEAIQRIQASFFDVPEVANTVLHYAEPIQFIIDLAIKQTEMIAVGRLAVRHEPRRFYNHDYAGVIQSFSMADAMDIHVSLQ